MTLRRRSSFLAFQERAASVVAYVHSHTDTDTDTDIDTDTDTPPTHTHTHADPVSKTDLISYL
jgi:hypothetical protein